MKDKHLFYAVCIIAVLAVAAVGIGYTTDMLPLPKQSVAATANATQTDAKTAETSESATSLRDKNCGCCAERRAKYAEMMKKRRERQKAAAAAQQMASK